MARKHDFTLLQETHSNAGKVAALKLPHEFVGFWSDGTNHRAGVGIIVKKAFLMMFNEIRKEDWEEVQPGRIAILHLKGEHGKLDIVVVYMPTGEDAKAERKVSISKLSNKMQPHNEILTIMAGDFNFVTKHTDRINKDTGKWSGEGDKKDVGQFNAEVAKPFDLYEWEQEEATCDSPLARAKLDRVYSNHHVADKLDRHFSCAALQWTKGLSAHRPISFSNQKAENTFREDRPLPCGPMKEDAWPRRVKADYVERLQQIENPTNPAVRLLAMKAAIHQVTRQMEKEGMAKLAESTDDKLGWTMTFLRAAEGPKVKMEVMKRCVKAYPKLGTLVNHENPIIGVSGEMKVIRDHAVELSRQSIQDELMELKNASDMDETQRARKKDCIISKIRRMMPGTATGINAMRSESGAIVTDAPDMANVLRKHWGKAFSKRGINRGKLDEWIEDVFSEQHHGSSGKTMKGVHHSRWVLTKKEMRKAIRKSGNTSPGPDGKIYLAWRMLGETATTCLYDVADALTSEKGISLLVEAYEPDNDVLNGHDFNMSLLCCLPKKVSGMDDVKGDFYDPGNTRPLSIVNTDNRIIANAMRSKWEPVFNEWVSCAQKGFLKHRCMLSNILDIDAEAMVISMKEKYGGLILFDFRAAFPSVSHEFMMGVLEGLGIPKYCTNFILALYDCNKCSIACKGSKFEGFSIEAGIRQGCPLSPVIFAVVVDILLRKIQQQLPEGVTRAFADDIALLSNDLPRDADTIKAIFEEFAEISGLDLNLNKTVVIPLWEEPGDEEDMVMSEGMKAARINRIRQWVYPETTMLADMVSNSSSSSDNQSLYPEDTMLADMVAEPRSSSQVEPEHFWTKMDMSFSGKYLGFEEGPGKGEKTWGKAGEKFTERAKTWGKLGAGLQFATLAYNTFCLTVLTYVGQLEPPLSAIFAREEEALRRMTPGPGKWITPQDCWHLKESYGLCRSFDSIKKVAQAAKVRVHENDKKRVNELAERVRQAILNTEQHSRKQAWKDWYSRSHAVILQEATKDFEHRVSMVEAVSKGIAGRDRPWSEETHAKVKRMFQKKIKEGLIKAETHNAEDRMRHKFERWKLGNSETIEMLPGILAPRILKRLRDLQTMVAPRVSAACFGTI